jgi:hypothetical protein
MKTEYITDLGLIPIKIEYPYRGKLPLTLCNLTEEGKLAFENYHQQLKNFLD